MKTKYELSIRAGECLHDIYNILNKTVLQKHIHANEKSPLNPEAMEKIDQARKLLNEAMALLYGEYNELEAERKLTLSKYANYVPRPDVRVYSAVLTTDGAAAFGASSMGVSGAYYTCNVPMCGESGVCEECRKRGAR
jgi:hypothetical protein